MSPDNPNEDHLQATVEKSMPNPVSLDTNLAHLFARCLAEQKATSGLEKAQTKEGVIFAKGLDGDSVSTYCSCQLGSGQVLYHADLFV